MAQAKKQAEQKAEDETKTEIAEAAQEVEIDTQAETNVPAVKTEETAEEAADDPIPSESAELVADEPKAAKAGKRSKKAVEEAEAETERKQRAAEAKEAKTEEPAKPKVVHKPNPLKRRGKNYRQAADLVEKGKEYELEEALALAKKTSHVKFDASVEIHLNLGVDPRQADQMVRSNVVLPAGTGKSLRAAVLASPDKHEAAKKAGADLIGEKDLIAKIEKGQLDFDILIATPDMMSQLGKVAKVLGPKGLMPNPKSGTVTADVAKAVKEAKAGKVEFRIDKQSIVHQAIGKLSFPDSALLDNAKAMIDAVMKAKPAAAKGTYVKAAALTTSMGPGIKLNVSKAIAASNPKK